MKKRRLKKRILKKNILKKGILKKVFIVSSVSTAAIVTTIAMQSKWKKKKMVNSDNENETIDYSNEQVYFNDGVLEV